MLWKFNVFVNIKNKDKDNVTLFHFYHFSEYSINSQKFGFFRNFSFVRSHTKTPFIQVGKIHTKNK